MVIYPAIDIRRGRCVRLFQGDPERETVYGDNPLEMALRWQSKGARWIHVVDLDGAFSGEPIAREIVLRIARLLEIPIQVGGGVRSDDDVVRYLEGGVARVIVGTKALEDLAWFSRLCERFPERIALGLDARDGLVAVRGWRETTSVHVEHILEGMRDLPLAAVIYTDIGRDGTHRGVNVAATEKVVGWSGSPVIASGGVTAMGDIEALMPLVKKGLNGVIIGRALYDGTLDLGDLLRFVRSQRTETGGGRERWQD